MRITVKVKNVYGNDLVYPVCKDAQVFAQIAGSKTLTETTLKRIKDLGYQIVSVTPTVFN